MILYFASGNAHKADEIRSLLPQGIELKTLLDIHLDVDIPENGSTLLENAQIKAKYLSDLGYDPVFADDTGLEVEALDGSPGVYSARYAGPQRNHQDNVALLLNNLKHITNRKAQFVTQICCIYKGKKHHFAGKVLGKITMEPSGKEGFGYDPVFIPENETKTFAEMSLSEKNQYSHRARATQLLVEFVKQKIKEQ
jgi:XTP/dITP diphosphohydrolase